MSSFTLALAQINPTVGDIDANVALIVSHAKDAEAQGADMVVFPEMAITGYPPEDLVFLATFRKSAMQAVAQIADATRSLKCAILVGGLRTDKDKIFNSTFLIERGNIIFTRDKHARPNYGVFDEKRLFAKGDMPNVVEWRGVRLGILICEELWQSRCTRALSSHQPELVIVINASPFELGKIERRNEVAKAAAYTTGAPIVYVNLVGGQDELVFDGGSFAVNEQGEQVARMSAFESQLATVRVDGGTLHDAPHEHTPEPLASMYHAMVLGLRDYVIKNGFKGVVLGLSGGIDSALSAAIAVDALGCEKVRGLLMPSPFSSDHSIDDAHDLAQRLNITTDTLPIAPMMDAFTDALASVFAGLPADTTEENIQARIRGNVLMAYSNKHGFMVLTTGNKSEMAVGYATLYGDMCGGYSVLKDVYKTQVWALARWRNQLSVASCLLPEPIPQRSITKAPSAELKPNQTDQDSLPPYDVLDAMLNGLIEQRLSVDEVTANLACERADVARVARMVMHAEYKRRQAPPGVKITGMSFGRDRRFPLTSGWK